MMREGQVIGAIFVARTTPWRFPDSQIELLKTFADQAVIAIENVRLFTELEARNRDLTEALEQQTATSEILRVISSSPTDVQPVFDTIAANALRLCDATWSAVTRYDGEMMHLVSHHNVGDPREWRRCAAPSPGGPARVGVNDHAILTRTIANVTDTEDPGYQFGELRPRDGLPEHRRRADAPRRSAGGNDHRHGRSGEGVLPAAGGAPRNLRRPGRDRHRERPPLHGAPSADRRAHPVGRGAAGAQRGQPDGQLHPGPSHRADHDRQPRRAARRGGRRRGLRVRRDDAGLPAPGQPSDA